ncbi:hypothetical protein HN865_02930 [Candidatus Woesearchaeota archaeon]|jgi:hypothetical protein|nr:hypothetical protein [Candidatus Woesearchaeota archaeon]MBT7237788.1 hypothetical protein [Candidatus Woesearchaeota archaeon]
MKKLLILVLLLFISGCANSLQEKGDKYCEVDEDCECLSGNFCGCYNKDFVAPTPEPGYLCDAECMGFPCACINNICE